jgi:hypothetical protein
MFDKSYFLTGCCKPDGGNSAARPPPENNNHDARSAKKRNFVVLVTLPGIIGTMKNGDYRLAILRIIF